MAKKNDKKIDTAALLDGVDIVQLIDQYVPLVKSGAEYEACCPFHSEATPSFKVSPAKQFYHCFGCGAHGDAIKFLQEHQGLSFVEACRALGADVAATDTRERLGERASAQPAHSPEPGDTPVPSQRETPQEDTECTEWRPVLPVPADASPPPVAHIKRGKPSHTWTYRDAEGRVLGYVCRFETSKGGKEVLPLTWCRLAETGAHEWRWISFPAPRPLYGLERLAARPEATVLMVEGEKCADAGQAELPELVVLSWPGGSKAVDKADWSALAGRKVLGWADCDAKHERLTPADKSAGLSQQNKPLLPAEQQPGVIAMTKVGGHVLAQGGRWWDVTIPAPGAKPDGWDIADAIAEGLRGGALAEHIRNNLTERKPPPPPAEPAPTPTEAGAGIEIIGADPNAWRSLLLRKDDRIIDCRENIYLILKHHPAWAGVIHANVFARRIVKRQPPPWWRNGGFVPDMTWDDDDNLRLGLWLAQQERLIVRSADNLALAAGWAARESPWHPVRDYLDALEWDGVSRHDDWLTDYLGVRKTDYTVLSGRYFFTGMVARIYEPGCMLRSMPIIEGPQFQGKSTALRILGGEWFGDTTLDLNSKDVYLVIQGCWLYEIAELDAFNRSEATRIKAFISSLKDRFRAPYDRDVADHPRQTVFAGTTNQDEYFKDPTGNTRYWPWGTQEVDLINLDGLAAMRDQLFAEALARYRRRERWHPTREEQLHLFEPEQAAREIADPWQRLIYHWLCKQSSDRVNTNDVLFDCLKIEPGKVDGTRSMATRVGTVMKRLGWHKRRETEGGRGYYYERPAGDVRAGAAEQGKRYDGGSHVPF